MSNLDIFRPTTLFDRLFEFDTTFDSFRKQTRDNRLYWRKTHEDHQAIVIPAHGFNEDILKIEQDYDEVAEQAFIKVIGEFEDENSGMKNSINFKFWLNHENLNKITTKVKDGLVTINLWYKPKEKKTVLIEKE